MGINVTTSKQQITANVAEDKISATVTGGFGATGPSGVITVTAPITNSGTTTAANVGLSVGSGLSVSGGSLVVTPDTYATLVGGKVPAEQLPSYVDDVLEYANTASLPVTGESGKIYVALNTGKIYRWSGSAYFEISTQPGNTDAVPEGSSNFYFTNARARNAFGSGTNGQVITWSGGQWQAGTVFNQSLNSTDSPTFSELTLSGSKLHSPGGYVSLVVPETVTDTPLMSVDLNDAGGAPIGSVLVGVRSDAGAFVQSAAGPVRIEQSGGGLGQVLCSELAFESGSVQTEAWLGSVDAADVTGLGDLATQSSIGNITSDGRIGVTSGLLVATGAGGSLETAATLNSFLVSDAGTNEFNSDSQFYDVLLSIDTALASKASSTQYATSSVAGVVKIGSGIGIDANGVISASAGYTLPQATTSTLGGVIVGTGLSVASGTVSVTTYAVRCAVVGSTSYIGRAVAGSATSSTAWTIRRTVYTSAGAVSSTATATNVAWDNRLSATYS